MSGTHRTCEICHIKERKITEKRFLARFPLDKKRCLGWLKVVGKEDLAYLPVQKLHELHHICEIHFAKRDFTKTGTRLKKRAIPKLCLPTVPPLADHICALFLQLNSNVAESTSNSQAPQQVIYPTPAIASTSAMGTNSLFVLDQHFEAVVDTTSNREVPQQVIYPTADIASTSAVGTNSLCDLDKSQQLEAGMVSMDTIKEPTKTAKKRPLATSDLTNKDGSVNVIQPQETQTKPKLRKLSKADLSEREIQLYDQLEKTKSTIKSLKKSASLIDSIKSPLLKEIVMMTLKNQSRKPRGRRWNLKNKISLLAIFKRSPKTYRYLQHLIPLPCVSTLNNILHKIPMEPGIFHNLLEHMKKNCSKNPQNRVFSLLFDEIAIKPRAIYNSALDKIEGFTDLGNGERSADLADHALVFMLQGLKKKFKQPIAFYLVKGTISSHKLATLIIEVIKAVSEIGYTVMTTVCDQGPTNMGAINILTNLSSSQPVNNYFLVNGQKGFVIYDVPHLFKSIRNNFFNYGAMAVDGRIAKWEHLIKVEERNRNLLYLSKISEIHVQPKYRAKMKVKYAAQILSNTVAAVLKLLALAENNNEMMNTALVIQYLDRLFDYTNGPSGPDDVKKGLRRNVSSKTDHLQVWTDLRKKIESISFVKLSTGAKAKNVRCLKGFLVTLCSLRDIWLECQRLGFKYLNLRQLNQDALENLFGVVRQHSPTNRNPTASSFTAALKSSIITKLTAPHSRGSNCTKDTNKLLVDFDENFFINKNAINEEDKENIPIDQLESETYELAADQGFPVLSLETVEDLEDNMENEIINIDQQPAAYLSGFIAFKIKKKVKCTACHETLTVNSDTSSCIYEYIKLREWWKDKSSLTYPSHDLIELVKSCVHTFEQNCILTMHIPNLRLVAVTMFLANTDNLLLLGCSDHSKSIKFSIITSLASILIRRQCARINKVISYQEENLADLLKKGEQRAGR